MTDEAKAAEELAKLGQRSLETAEKAGGWVDKVFGEGFQQLGGTWADSMAGLRYRNRIRVLQKTQAAIAAAGLSGGVRSLSERIALPLLEAISDESDDGLQDVWAAYIRNAVNPSKPRADRILIDVIRRLEPADWPILEKLFQSDATRLKAEDFGLSENELSEVMDRLVALGLVDFDDKNSAYLVISTPDQILTVECRDGQYFANRVLRMLKLATSE